MTIEELQLKIESDAHGAVFGIDSLTKSLQSLKAATANSAGLGKVSSAMQTLKTATQGLQLGNLGTQMGQLAAGLKHLEALGKNKLSGFISSLKQIPKVTTSLDPATMDRFAAAVHRAATAMKPLADEMNKIAMGFSAMPKRIQSFITQMERSGKAATTAATGYKKMGTILASIKSMFSFGFAYAIIKKVGSVLGGLVNTAAAYVEDINLFSVTLGQYAESIGAYADRAQELLGIDATQFLKYTGVFMGIADGLGVATDAAALMSQNLAQLGYDLASFWNVTNDEAMSKLQSALTGQTRTMLEFGTSVHVATLEEVAMRHGITQSVAAMSEAQKVQLRYIAIMDATAAAQGDLARTLASPSNQIRVFSQQVQLLARSLGNILIPILNAVLPVLQVFVMLLRMAADAVATLFGFKLPTVDYSGVSAMSGGISDAEDSAAGLADNVGDAAKNAKKLKDYMLGFDELNILKPEEAETATSGGGGSGAGGGAGGDLGIDLPTYDFLDGLEAKANETLEKIKGALKPFADAWNNAFSKIDWSKLTSAAQNVKDAFAPLGKNIADGLLWVWENVLVPVAAWTVGDVLPAFLNILAGAFKVLNSVIEALKPLAMWLWDNFLKPIAEWTGGLIVDALNAVADGLTAISDWINEHQKTVETLTILVGSFAAAWVLVNGAIAIWNAVGAIAAAVTAAFGGAVAFLTSPIGIVVVAIGALIAIGVLLARNWDEISAFLTQTWENIKTFAATVWDGISNYFAGVWEGIKTTAVNVWEGIKSFFSGLWDGIKNVFNVSLDFIKNLFPGTYNAIKGVINDIERIFKGLIDFVAGVFTGDWSRAWEGVVNIFGGIFSGIANLFKAPINFVIDGINFFLRGLNNIKIPSWVPGVGGMGFSIPEIPKLNVGMDFVPANDYLAYLHYGEAVLTANDAAVWRSLGGTAGIQALAGDFTPGGGSISGLAMSNVSIQQPSQQGSNASEIAAAVYEAMLAANAQNTDRPIQVTVEMNGRQMFEENIRQDQTYGYPAFRQSAVNLG